MSFFEITHYVFDSIILMKCPQQGMVRKRKPKPLPFSVVNLQTQMSG